MYGGWNMDLNEILNIYNKYLTEVNDLWRIL